MPYAPEDQRLMCRSSLLQDFNIEIRYKKGLENVLADALSRSWMKHLFRGEMFDSLGGE